MKEGVVHYREGMDAYLLIEEINRVSRCGAITQHSVPQTYVRETGILDLVTCKNCLRREKIRARA